MSNQEMLGDTPTAPENEPAFMTPKRKRAPRATIAAAAVKLLEALRRGQYGHGTRAAEVLALALERDGDAPGAALVRAAATMQGHTMTPLRSADAGDWREPTATLDDIVFDDAQRATFERLAIELEAAPRFIAAGIDAPTRIFFHGPSGTGKTLAAQHLAARLGVPLLVGRLNRIVDSHMGETSKNVAGLFATASSTPSIVFLDEIDGFIGPRGVKATAADAEIARSTSSLLQQLDMLPPEQIVIAASNFPGEIDGAFYRRFPTRLSFVMPGTGARERMIRRWWRQLPSLIAEGHATALAAQTEGMSGAEVRARAMEQAREMILRHE